MVLEEFLSYLFYDALLIHLIIEKVFDIK